MGNYRFRLSDMMPNAWFYKLREMSRGRRGQSIPHSMKNRSHPKIAATTGPKPFPQAPPQLKQAHLSNRRSCYFSTRGETEQRSPCSPVHHKASDTQFPVQPPRKSKRRSRRKPIKHSTNLVSSSVSAGCSCRVWESKSLSEKHDDYTDDDLHKPIIADHLEFNDIESWSRLCSCRLTSSATDIIIDMAGSKSKSKSSFSRTLDQFEDFKSTSELELPPILTKPAMKEEQSLKVHAKFPATKEQSKGTPRKSPPELHRLRLRANSPRVVSKRVPTCRARKSSATMGKQQKGGLSDYFAVMKLSSDPQREFRDSMVEMIVENNIRASKDLEDLLACYLSLNSNEYHDVIIKVFEQIWFDLTDIRL